MGSWNWKCVDINQLNGKTIESVSGLKIDSEEVRIATTCGFEFAFWHAQDCCEHVRLNDFEAGTDDFSGALIVSAEKVDGDQVDPDSGEAFLWTFYKIETSKGEIFMRWLGESNGYYGMDVDFHIVRRPGDDGSIQGGEA